MSKNNKVVREELEKMYGKGCWFAKTKLAERLEKVDGVLSYKKFVEKQHYSRKRLNRLEKTMSLHHLVHRSERTVRLQLKMEQLYQNLLIDICIMD